MDFRGIVLSEEFSWPKPLPLHSEDGRRVSFGKCPMRALHQSNVFHVSKKYPYLNKYVTYLFRYGYFSESKLLTICRICLY